MLLVCVLNETGGVCEGMGDEEGLDNNVEEEAEDKIAEAEAAFLCSPSLSPCASMSILRFCLSLISSCVLCDFSVFCFL